MVFILRAIFWIAVVAAFVPAGFSAPQDGAFAREASAIFQGASGVQSVSASQEARQFCLDRPEACAVASRFADFTGFTAQYAAARAEDYIETRARREDIDALFARASDAPSR